MDIDGLCKAAFDDDAVTVVKALRQGVDPNQAHPNSGKTPLSIASSRGALAAATALLEAGADPNQKLRWQSSMSTANWSGRTALMLSSTAEMVTLLVKHGARIDEKDVNGWSAVAHAANLGRRGALEALAVLGSDLNIEVKKGTKRIGLVELIDLEISEFGARPDAESNAEIQTILDDLRAMRGICLRRPGNGERS